MSPYFREALGKMSPKNHLYNFNEGYIIGRVVWALQPVRRTGAPGQGRYAISTQDWPWRIYPCLSEIDACASIEQIKHACIALALPIVMALVGDAVRIATSMSLVISDLQIHSLQKW